MRDQSDPQKLVQTLSELEAVLSRAEHNGVNLIFGMGGQRLCHVCEKYQVVVREALKLVRANLPSEPDSDDPENLNGDAGTAR